MPRTSCLVPDADGRIWSEQLGAALGLRHGVWDRKETAWVRLFHADGSLVPTEAEYLRAEAERQRAEAERLRAERAEAELARLRALLAERDPG